MRPVPPSVSDWNPFASVRLPIEHPSKQTKTPKPSPAPSEIKSLFCSWTPLLLRLVPVCRGGEGLGLSYRPLSSKHSAQTGRGKYFPRWAFPLFYACSKQSQGRGDVLLSWTPRKRENSTPFSLWLLFTFQWSAGWGDSKPTILWIKNRKTAPGLGRDCYQTTQPVQKRFPLLSYTD